MFTPGKGSSVCSLTHRTGVCVFVRARPPVLLLSTRAVLKKKAAMEKSKNFRIDALLADETNRGSRDLSPGQSSDSAAGSPVSCRRADTPSPRATQLHTGIIPKSGILNLPHPGLASLPHGAIPGMYPTHMYPLSALGSQHPAFSYSGFTQLTQGYPEHLKAAAMAGHLPLEHWIRAGIMMPRLPDYSCEYLIIHFVAFFCLVFCS